MAQKSYDLSVSMLATGGVGNLIQTWDAPLDMHPKLWSVYPGATPFLSIFSKLSEETARNPRIDWREEVPIPSKVVLGNSAGTGTALTIPNGYRSLVRQTILYHPELNDYAVVSATPTTSAVTVTRSELGSTAASWAANDVLWVLPPQSTENEEDVYRTSSAITQNGYNLIQLIRMGTGISRIVDNTDTYDGGQGVTRTRLQGQKLNEVKEKLEQGFWVNARATSGTAPATYRTFGGIVGYLRDGSLYKDFDGFLTESGFRRWLSDYKDMNPDTQNVKLFTSGNVIEIMSDWGLNKVQINDVESKKYGFAINLYISGRLRVDLVEVPLFNDPTSKGWMFILDMDRIALKYLQGSRLQLLRDCKGIGQSEIIYDIYRCAPTLMLANESRHSMAVGALL